MTYKQCKLTQKTDTGIVSTVGYIEAEHAKVGVRLTLEDMDGIWTVKEVWGSPVDLKTLDGQRRTTRPGRIDRICHFGLPDHGTRVKIAKAICKDDLKARIYADQTDGYSQAQLAEWVSRHEIDAHFNGQKAVEVVSKAS